MPGKTTDRPSARERILAAANELFYEEGVQTVGIDRIIEHAGVAKASLYNTFGSKDELVKSYLQARHESRRARLTRWVEQQDDPRDRLLAVFDALQAQLADPEFHGCAFMNASAEAKPGSSIEAVCDLSRGWVRALLVDLAAEAGARDPEKLAQQLVLLYDGATVGARLDRDPSTAAAARAVAASLIDLARS
jgi:AcrR family transcriptional regulator